MEYLVVNTEGRVLAVLESLEEVVRELRRLGRDPHASGRVRVVRHEVHDGEVMGVESFVTASPLPSLRDPHSQPPKPSRPRRGLRLRPGPPKHRRCRPRRTPRAAVMPGDGTQADRQTVNPLPIQGASSYAVRSASRGRRENITGRLRALARPPRLNQTRRLNRDAGDGGVHCEGQYRTQQDTVAGGGRRRLSTLIQSGV
jgi:hypothetical protein